jgi:hypothetical protein
VNSAAILIPARGGALPLVDQRKACDWCKQTKDCTVIGANRVLHDWQKHTP